MSKINDVKIKYEVKNKQLSSEDKTICTVYSVRSASFELEGTEYLVCQLPKDFMRRDAMDSWISNPCIYLYFGVTPRNEYSGDVYIGKASSCSRFTEWTGQVKEDDRELENWKKKYWRYTVIMTTMDEPWTQDDLSYIEYMIYYLTVYMGAYNVLNTIGPNGTNIHNVNRKKLNKVLDVMETIMENMGCGIIPSMC